MAKNASSTPNCSMNFCYCRDRSIQPGSSVKPPTTTSCAPAPRKLDKVAVRLLSGVTAAFFASLERCSCINIATKDDVDDGGSLPLIPDDVIYPAADVRFSGSAKEEENRMIEDHKDAIHVNP
ncbi:hypothetical protein CDL12_29755 [Handroanthus impetiginosus]|uniref:Uncharacterized protein n=1 Tax=Handroanthus impetiginosus TaxID=429701 RepID=A0A2G9FXI2_9LAMI|nr:hypothetical protein CDL12_29755 [Handroanthus impetiginosus]